MVVTGTEQRVYGTLTASNSCLIDLHRFALVYGSATLSPTQATTVYYADNYPYKQCGYTYNGFITSLFIISGTTAIGIVETRICKNDPNRIVIETYGEVAPSQATSLWFNKGSDETPDWQLLNSTTSGTIFAYNQKSFTFKETTSVKKGATLIDCCKKCPSCGCKNCDIADRFTITGIGKLPVDHTCCDIVYLEQSYDWLNESVGKTIYIYYYNGNIYGTKYRYYKADIAEVVSTSAIKLDQNTYGFLGGSGNIADDAINETYNTTFEYSSSINQWPIINRIYIGPLGFYALQGLRFTFHVTILVECSDATTGPWGPDPYVEYIYIGTTLNSTYGMDGYQILERVYNTYELDQTYTRITNSNAADSTKNYLYITPEIQIKSSAPFKYHRVTCNVELLEIVDCNDLQKPLDSTFLCIPARSAHSQYFYVCFGDAFNPVPSRQNLSYPYDSSLGGDYSIVCTNNYTTTIIQYKMTYNTLDIVVQISGNVYWIVYYRDDLGVNNLIASGFEA